MRGFRITFPPPVSLSSALFHTMRHAIRSTAAALLLTLPSFASSATVLGVDENNNGLSDVYEILHPGLGAPAADDDADGHSNAEEAAAGTDPASGADKLDFAQVTNAPAGVDVRFPTENGKVYQMQVSSSLTGGAWQDEGSPFQGNGAEQSGTCPYQGARMFLRLRVQDKDSDGDGATDWEEFIAGTSSSTNDTNGDGVTDAAQIAQQLAAQNEVNAWTLQPQGSEVGGRPLIFRITRQGNLNPLTVAYTLSGTATPGVDFSGSAAGHVVFPAGATTATVTITPLPDAATEGSETLTLTLSPGAGYVPGIASATGTLHDSFGGLVGQYFNTQETTYLAPPATNLNFDPAQLKLTRLDPVLDFAWGSGPPAGTGLTDANAWSIRWTGSIIAPVSGNYTLHARFDRGCVMYVNGVRVLDQWSATMGTTAPEFSTAALPFTAGQRVPVTIDYRESGTTSTVSDMHLLWTRPDAVKEIIPLTALSPEPPVISSPDFTTVISGAPVSFAVSAPGATQFTASGLPASLTLDATTGVLSGTGGTTPGLDFITITASNAYGSDTQSFTLRTVATGGSVTREIWTGVSGSSALAVPVSTTPTTTQSITTLQAPSNYGDSFGERIRGYITAPSTGLYTFFLSSDETAEFWISADEEPGRKLKRSYFTGATILPGAWDTVGTQRALSMTLTAGQRYYFEILRLESSGNDHLAAGWLKPGEAGTSPGEIIPSWALSPYTPPAAAVNDGFLYAATLTPQNGAVTLGTGSALLKVAADWSSAEMTVSWGNLTGPVNNSHIHDIRNVPGPATAIIFDIDDADPDRLLPGGDGLDPNEVYHWDIIPTGQHSLQDVIDAVQTGNSYINLHTAAYPNGEIRGFFQPVIGSQFFTPPAAPPPAELTLPSDPTARTRAISRFMQQATFGPAPDADGVTDGAPANAAFNGWQPDSMEAVASMGYAAWLDAQLAMDPGPDPETLVMSTLPPTTVYTAPTNARRTPNTYFNERNGSGPMARLIKEYYDKYPRSGPDPNGDLIESSNEIWRSWWKLSSTAPDQVRHRVAFALSQILVVSEEGGLDERARWVGHYYDLLYWHGLGNFRTLLEKVTLNPSMGRYLDMLNNRKPNPATGYIPNENYAREIMQLFSIGLRRLHPDGTLVLDERGLPLTSYTQDEVVGLAHVFTGWRLNGGDWISPMVVNTGDHDTGNKRLLENTVIPANASPTTTSCNTELAQAHELLFQHPNTGPFICRQLIQRMVTANPSPGYIYRAAKVFADNGSGVRGDMKAVVRAILLDPEARNASPSTQVGFGHLKEPVVRATQMIRAFKGFSLAERLPLLANSNDLGMAMFSPITNVDLTQPLPQRTDRWPDSTSRTLSASIPATPATGSLTITLSAAATAVVNGDIIRIDAEDFLVTAGAGTASLTVDRAQLGTVAAAHAAGTAVNRMRPYQNNYIDEQIDPDGTGPLGVSTFSMIVQPGNVILLRRQQAGSTGGALSNGETYSPENGLYVVEADPANAGRYRLARAANADSAAELEKAFVKVSTCRQPNGTLSGNRIYYQQQPVATLGTTPLFWVNQSQTTTSKGTAVFSPATSIDLAATISSTTGTTRTATLTESIGGNTYTFSISTGNILLLRRQSANAGFISADGDTSSPENGIYVVANDTVTNRVKLQRATNSDTAAELNNAGILVTRIRMDDGSLYPAVSATEEIPSRTYRQELTVTTLGTDAVRFVSQVPGAGINRREAWGIGSTGSSSFQQTPLRSPTVFNFYEPDYVFTGATGDAGLYSPEFQITTETSVVTVANWFYDLTRRNSTNTATSASPWSYGQGASYGDPFKRDVKLDLTVQRDLANSGGNSAALVDHLGNILMPGRMTPRLKTLLTGFLDTIPAADDAGEMDRLGEALYLISMSPEFATQQ